MSIVFEDDDVLNFTGVELKHDMKGDKNSYQALPLLSKDDFIKFKTKKVKLFKIADETVRPFVGNFKDKVKAYANCLDTFTDAPAPVLNANEKKSIDGFWGIKFGATADEVKAAVAAKGGKLNTESSKEEC